MLGKYRFREEPALGCWTNRGSSCRPVEQVVDRNIQTVRWSETVRTVLCIELRHGISFSAEMGRGMNRTQTWCGREFRRSLRKRFSRSLLQNTPQSPRNVISQMI